MANDKLGFPHPDGRSGLTLYAIIRNMEGQAYDTTTGFEAYATGTITDYDIALTEQGTASRYYEFTFPAIAKGQYQVSVYERIGGSPAEGDPIVAEGTVHWQGIALGMVLAVASIETNTFSSGAITSTVLAADCIGASQIAADAIGSSELAASAVTEIWAAGTRTLTSAANITSTGGTITVTSGGVTLADGVTHGGTTAKARFGSSTSTPAFYVTSSAGDAVKYEVTAGDGMGLSLMGFGLGSGLYTEGGASGYGVFANTLLVSGAVTFVGAVTATNASNDIVGIDVAKWIGVVPNTLTNGRVDATVGHIQNASITTAAFASAAITSAVLATDCIGAAQIAADAIGSSELAATAVTEIQSGLATSVSITALDAKVDVIDDFLDTEIAAIKAKTDNLPVDPADASDIASSFGTVNTTLATIAGYLDTEVAAVLAAVDTEVAAIKAKTDNLPSDPADASDIATSFSTVNTTLATIAGYIDTEVAAIKAKTDNLPADPADASDIATSFTTINTKLDAIDDYIDSEVAAIKAKTDLIPASPASTGDAMTLTSGERDSIADAVLTRDVSNVEASAGAHSLCYVVLSCSENVIVDNTMTVYRTNGSTVFATKTLTKTAGDDPIRGIT